MVIRKKLTLFEYLLNVSVANEDRGHLIQKKGAELQPPDLLARVSSKHPDFARVNVPSIPKEKANRTNTHHMHTHILNMSCKPTTRKKMKTLRT